MSVLLALEFQNSDLNLILNARNLNLSLNPANEAEFDGCLTELFISV